MKEKVGALYSESSVSNNSLAIKLDRSNTTDSIVNNGSQCKSNGNYKHQEVDKNKDQANNTAQKKAVDPQKMKGPREYAHYVGSSARAEWLTFLFHIFKIF